MYLTFYTRAEKSFALRNFSQPGFVRATRGKALSIESIAFNRRKAYQEALRTPGIWPL